LTLLLTRKGSILPTKWNPVRTSRLGSSESALYLLTIKRKKRIPEKGGEKKKQRLYGMGTPRTLHWKYCVWLVFGKAYSKKRLTGGGGRGLR